MEESKKDKIVSKIDCIINLAKDKELLNHYPTVDLMELIENEFVAVRSLKPHGPDIGHDMDNFQKEY